jgi:hypothetical protein
MKRKLITFLSVFSTLSGYAQGSTHGNNVKQVIRAMAASILINPESDQMEIPQDLLMALANPRNLRFEVSEQPEYNKDGTPLEFATYDEEDGKKLVVAFEPIMKIIDSYPESSPITKIYAHHIILNFAGIDDSNLDKSIRYVNRQNMHQGSAVLVAKLNVSMILVINLMTRSEAGFNSRALIGNFNKLKEMELGLKNVEEQRSALEQAISRTQASAKDIRDLGQKLIVVLNEQIKTAESVPN